MNNREGKRDADKMLPKIVNLKQTKRYPVNSEAVLPHVNASGRENLKWCKHQPDNSSQLECDRQGGEEMMLLAFRNLESTFNQIFTL